MPLHCIVTTYYTTCNVAYLFNLFNLLTGPLFNLYSMSIHIYVHLTYLFNLVYMYIPALYIQNTTLHLSLSYSKFPLSYGHENDLASYFDAVYITSLSELSSLYRQNITVSLSPRWLSVIKYTWRRGMYTYLNLPFYSGSGCHGNKLDYCLYKLLGRVAKA